MRRLWRRWRRPQLAGECQVCGARVTGRRWWSLAQVHTDDVVEHTYGGGTFSRADFCRKHVPEARPGVEVYHH